MARFRTTLGRRTATPPSLRRYPEPVSLFQAPSAGRPAGVHRYCRGGKTMRPCIRKILVIAATAGLFGCDETREFVRELDGLVAREIPIGSERTAVVAFLRKHG